MIAVLNNNNDCSTTLDSLKAEKILLCTNCKEKYASRTNIDMIEAVPNVAACRNSIISKAREMGATKLFMVDDDIKVMDTSIFDKYSLLMDVLQIGFVFYGYNSPDNGINDNKAMNRPNPAVAIRMSEGVELWFNRYPATGVLGFDLTRNPLLFEESFKVLELQEYVQRCCDNGVIKTGSGFFADYMESFKYFQRLDMPNKRVRTQQMYQEDQKIINEKKIQFKVEMVVDTLLNYLKTLQFPEKI